MCGFFSQHYVLLHWCIFLFLCQCHSVMITMALQYSLKSGSMTTPTLLYFSRDYFGYSRSLCFYTDFKNFCSSFEKRQEMQINTIIRYHFTLVRMAIIKILQIISNRQVEEKIGTFLHCWWGCKLLQPLWRTSWKFLNKTNKIIWSCNPTPGHVSRENRNLKKCIHPNVQVALFT